jgi:hypothetical protein
LIFILIAPDRPGIEYYVKAARNQENESDHGLHRILDEDILYPPHIQKIIRSGEFDKGAFTGELNRMICSYLGHDG